MSAGATKSQSGSGSLLELVLIVATALGLALAIQAFLVKPYRIPSPSMEPTLAIGQRVLVNRLGNRFSQPEVGDIMVFHPPAGAEEASQCANPGEGQGEASPCSRSTQRRAEVNFIKRVVGVAGDRIAIRNGRVVRNGELAREPFVRPCEGEGGCDFPQEITVPPGHYFMMGDNRGASDDSRFWGPVPRDWLIGGAFATYWPPGRIGPL